MNENLELDRLAKENDNFKKIIQTQQNTINRMIDLFWAKKNLDCKSSFFRVTML